MAKAAACAIVCKRKTITALPHAIGSALASLSIAATLVATPAAASEWKRVQLRVYTASGTHQCGPEKGQSCVVTGSGFSNCNDATITLKTRNCCATTVKGGTSSGFVLNYCIPDRAL
jgi:hypothetical protein